MANPSRSIIMKIPAEVLSVLNKRLTNAEADEEKNRILSTAFNELRDEYPSSVNQLLDHARTIAESTELPSVERDSLIFLAAVHYKTGNITETVLAFYHAYQLHLTLELPQDWYSTFIVLCQKVFGDDENLRSFCQEINVPNGSDDISYLYHRRVICGVLLSGLMHQPERALNMFRQAVRDAVYLEDVSRKRSAELQYVLQLILSGNESVLKGVESTELEPDSLEYNLLTALEFELSNEFEQALAYYSKAFVLALQHKRLSAMNLRNRAEIMHIKLHDTLGAIPLLEQAIAMAQEDEDKHLTAELRKLCADYYTMSGNHAKALEHLRGYVSYVESVAQRDEMLSLETKYDVQNAYTMRERRRVHLSNLEVRSLRAHLHPQLLFNSLMAIQYFMVSNSTERAHHYLSMFAAYMRQALNNAREPLILLSDELECLHRYLKLQELRLGSIFTCDMDTETSLDTSMIYVPPMILQPIIEDALWQGVHPHNSNFTTNITIVIERVRNNTLRIRITDNVVRKSSDQLGNEVPAYPDYPNSAQLIHDRLKVLSNVTGAKLTVKQSGYSDDEDQPSGSQTDIHIPMNLQPEDVT